MYFKMDLQTVTTTYAQRNFPRVLSDLGVPKVVMKDSQPVAVVVDYQEFLRMRNFERDRLGREFEAALDRMQSRNKNLDEKKLDKLIKEALHAAGRD